MNRTLRCCESVSPKINIISKIIIVAGKVSMYELIYHSMRTMGYILLPSTCPRAVLDVARSLPPTDWRQLLFHHCRTSSAMSAYFDPSTHALLVGQIEKKSCPWCQWNKPQSYSNERDTCPNCHHLSQQSRFPHNIGNLSAPEHKHKKKKNQKNKRAMLSSRPRWTRLCNLHACACT